ncbi:FecCD family ABC transporter permease [Candidatus Cetobacterium colombiensis]|uniref:Iron ABC transporter permease n=1 Tax=Candidatus Cetobacterium colombiensis TaxID=3073100 RepID=A0ABU4W7F8_9FUSO|nr:iron ABC transporter permease [Candidatus Cetobacterium colombiensis]MDX8335461.1 iron ABC transporter permease [Candidatus Cetobacterium colombiensis]
MKKHISLILILGIILTGTLSIGLGSVSVPLEQLFSISTAPDYIKTIIYEIRLPRIVMALLIGMMLSSSGVVVQAVFQNPLADPYIIGIAASATFGAVTAYVFQLPDIFYGVLAFLSCLISTFIIFKLSNRSGKVDITTLLIVGIAVSAFIGAFTSFAMYLIGEESFKITMWLMGYLGGATWTKVLLLIIPLVFSLIFFYLQRNQLDALLSGDEEANSLGVDVHTLKAKVLTVSALVVAFSVAFSGMIGFVGLIIPHSIRMLVGPSNSKLIPNAALAGGFFLLICDTIGRLLLAPIEIPIGVVTAFFGAPFFLYLAFKAKGGN